MNTTTHFNIEPSWQAADGFPVSVRWMVRRDLPAVVGIEQACFEFPWQKEDFLGCMQSRNCIGMVAAREEWVVGFMIYETKKRQVDISSIVVHPRYQRRSVGSQMMRKLIDKLANQKRYRIILQVRESNLPALCFFRLLGFRVRRISKNCHEGGDEDVYEMEYSVAKI